MLLLRVLRLLVYGVTGSLNVILVVHAPMINSFGGPAFYCCFSFSFIIFVCFIYFEVVDVSLFVSAPVPPVVLPASLFVFQFTVFV